MEHANNGDLHPMFSNLFWNISVSRNRMGCNMEYDLTIYTKIHLEPYRIENVGVYTSHNTPCIVKCKIRISVLACCLTAPCEKPYETLTFSRIYLKNVPFYQDAFLSGSSCKMDCTACAELSRLLFASLNSVTEVSWVPVGCCAWEFIC